MSDDADLLATLRANGGQSAQAEVTKTKRGKAVKGDPNQILWKVTLRVRPDHGSAFSVDVQTPYPKLDGGPSLGSRIGVVYDPKNHSKIAVDPNARRIWGQAQAETMNRIVAQASPNGACSSAGSGSADRARPGRAPPRPRRAPPRAGRPPPRAARVSPSSSSS